MSLGRILDDISARTQQIQAIRLAFGDELPLAPQQLGPYYGPGGPPGSPTEQGDAAAPATTVAAPWYSQVPTAVWVGAALFSGFAGALVIRGLTR